MKNKVYSPLIIIEVYLCFSLILLAIGPINYHLHSLPFFLFLISFYHFAFIIGYIIGARSYSSCRNDILYTSPKNFRNRYSIVLFIVFYTWIIVNRNNTHASSYIPIDLFRRLMQGITNPSELYYFNKSDAAMNQFHGNRLVTATVFLTYFLYYCLPAIAVLSWKKISQMQKLFSVILVLLALLTGLSVGTNGIIFHVIFSLFGGLAIKFYNNDDHKRNNRRGKSIKKKRRNIKIVIIMFSILGILYFVYNIDNRLGNDTLGYFIHGSDITLRPIYETLVDIPIIYPFVKGLVSIESYLCQGYYGMSLALEQPFTTTYGLGHSFFIAISMDSTFGTDIISRTYQEKITNIWSRSSSWHSFYSQMANDVSFIGVIIIMFALGMIISRVWKDVIEHNNQVAKLFFVQLLPLFIFIPMNNQLGNFYGTFFSFWILYILWAISRKYVIRIGKLRI